MKIISKGIQMGSNMSINSIKEGGGFLRTRDEDVAITVSRIPVMVRVKYYYKNNIKTHFKILTEDPQRRVEIIPIKGWGKESETVQNSMFVKYLPANVEKRIFEDSYYGELASDIGNDGTFFVFGIRRYI